MTTTAKLWLGFGTLTALLMLSSVAILLRVRSFEEQVDTMADARDLSAETRELEINVLDYALCVRSLALLGDPKFRREAAVSAADVERHSSAYQRLATTDQQRQLATRFAASWKEFESLGRTLLDAEGSQRTLEDSNRFSDLCTQLETLLDDEIQVGATEHYESSRDAALQGVRAIVGLALLVLSVGAVIAAVTSVAVGRGVVLGERRLSASRERLRVTLASIGDGVIATDTRGRVSYLNVVAESLTGWKNAAAADVPLEQVFHIINEETRQPAENPATRALREGTLVGLANHTVLIAKDGTERPIDDSAAPIRDDRGNIAGVVLVFRDVTERRRAQEALRRAYDELELRVTQRTAELAHSNQFLRALLESLREGIVACDAEGVLTLFNRATREFLGLAPEPLHAEQWADHYDLFRSDGTTRMTKDEVPLLRALRGERLKEVELVIASKGGRPRTLLAAGQAFHDAEGRVLGAVVTMRDITRRKRAEEALQTAHDELEVRVTQRTAELSIANDALRSEAGERQQAEAALVESEQRFRMLADHMSQLAWTADARGWIHWYNQRWYDYTGTTREEMQGWGWKQVHHPEHVDRVITRIQHAWDTGEPWEDTFPLRGKDGQYRWFLSRALPIRDEAGNVLRWFGTNTDVTEQREMAHELRQTAADLSEADRRKNEFLAMLAHELRNPLAPIRNALQIVKLAQGDGEAVQSACEVMERQVGQMVRLVDDLLDVSRITRGKIDLRRERVDLASVLHQAVETCLPAIEGARHELTLTLPSQSLYLDADPVRLAQAISNLLNNSCKYSEPGGRIWLTAERQGSDVAVSVKDTGVGIPPDMLPHIFELFTQVDLSLERSQGGLGIGLTLVQRLVEMHGGSVSASSEGPGRGSEFVVRLPILIGNRSPSPVPAVWEPTPTSPRRILVVDDNRDSATSLAKLLKLAGNETLTAHDGLEAFEVAGAIRPDVVLLDIGLPKLNGYEVARKIREQPWGKSMVLVALTGWGQEEDRRKSTEAGFDGHMVKPVDYSALMKLLAETKTSASHVGDAS